MKLTLNNWKISPSPYTGLSTAVNCDTRSVSGEIKAGKLLKKSYFYLEEEFHQDFLILASAQDDNGNTFAVTENADVLMFQSSSSSPSYLFNIQSWLDNFAYTLSVNEPVFLDYMDNGWFIFTFNSGFNARAATFNASGLSSSNFFSPTMTLSAQFKSQIDNILYFGGYDNSTNKNVIGSFEPLPNFDPTNPVTFNIVYEALDFEDGQREPTINAINEYGEFLVIARGDRLYTWDREEAFFENQITVSGGNIKILAKLNNNLYAITDGDGRMYQTNGSSVLLIAKIVDYVRTLEQGYSSFFSTDAGGPASSFFERIISVSQNAVFQNNDRIFLAVNMYDITDSSSGSSSGSNYYYPTGVFSVTASGDVDFETTIVGGDYISRVDYVNPPTNIINVIKVGHINKLFNGDMIVSGYKYQTTGSAISEKSVGTFFDGYFNGLPPYVADAHPFFETPVYIIGSPKQNTTPQHLEIILGAKFKTGDAIRISYRTDAVEPYTEFAEFTYDSYGALSSLYTEFAPTADKIQLKVELQGRVRVRELIIS